MIAAAGREVGSLHKRVADPWNADVILSSGDPPPQLPPEYSCFTKVSPHGEWYNAIHALLPVESRRGICTLSDMTLKSTMPVVRVQSSSASFQIYLS